MNRIALLFAGPAAFAAVAFSPATTQADLVEETITYVHADGTPAKGFLVYDDDLDGERPGVLVIPEWWGLNDYPKMRARELAEEGAIAFVADMYGNGVVTDQPAEASRLSKKAGETGLAVLAQPALEQLKAVDGVNEDAIGAIGFCFGGTTVIEMAKSDYASELAGVVSFHGSLNGDLAPEGDYAGPPMLVLHGSADPFVPNDAFSAFVQKTMDAGAEMLVGIFPGAKHAFTNPDSDDTAERTGLDGVGYDEAAAEASMEMMDDFFEMKLEGFDDEDDD